MDHQFRVRCRRRQIQLRQKLLVLAAVDEEHPSAKKRKIQLTFFFFEQDKFRDDIDC